MIHYFPPSPHLSFVFVHVRINTLTQTGFFYIMGHGVDPAHVLALEAASRVFFSQPTDVKMRVSMDKGGPAWRGYFRVGDELTSGLPDLKEGLYFGTELPADAPAVVARIPMHGANLWPRSGDGDTRDSNNNAETAAATQTTEASGAESESESKQATVASEFAETAADAELRTLVLSHLTQMTALGHTVMSGVSRALGLPPDFLRARFMRDPLCLFRIFNYPAPAALKAQFAATGALLSDAAATVASESARSRPLWSVGEHTDYGMLTILHQDQSGGLQVRRVADGRWAPAPPVAGSFVVNIGDMLERLTGGLFVSTPHRVLNPANAGRISFPFFFDPSFDADTAPLLGESERLAAPRAANGSAATTYTRWDGRPVGLADVQGTYGQYILGKVAKVFPQLAVQERIAADKN